MKPDRCEGWVESPPRLAMFKPLIISTFLIGVNDMLIESVISSLLHSLGENRNLSVFLWVNDGIY